MRKNKFIIILILTVFFLVYLSFASHTYSFDASYWEPSDQEGGAVINNIGNTIVGLVSLVGSGISIITIIIIGIKYMLGSVEERADYKKSMIPYIVGAIMVFGISNIVNILYEVGSTILK